MTRRNLSPLQLIDAPTGERGHRGDRRGGPGQRHAHRTSQVRGQHLRAHQYIVHDPVAGEVGALE